MSVPPDVSAAGWEIRPEVPPTRQGGSRRPWVVSLIVAAAGALLAIGSILVAAGSSDYRTMHHPGGGMAPTIEPDADVTVRKLDGGQVRRGDIVLTTAPDWGLGGPVLQRVVGIGGDHIVLPLTGDLIRNGRPVHEPYVYDGIANGLPQAFDFTVPAGRVLLLGDHRADCMDSRFHLDTQDGTVARTAVVGIYVPSAEVSAPGRLWTWTGAGITLAGLAAALFAFTRRRRRTALPTTPAGEQPVRG